MTTAIDLDRALASLTAEHIAAVRMNPAFAAEIDQLRAALQESVRLIESAGAGPPRSVRLDRVDDWLRLGLLDTFVQWTAGKARTCIHQPCPRRPEPVWSAAWRPGLVVCQACIGLLRVRGDADLVCDCCGRQCRGIEADDPVHTSTVWFGALAYMAGACAECGQHLDSAYQTGESIR